MCYVRELNYVKASGLLLPKLVSEPFLSLIIFNNFLTTEKKDMSHNHKIERDSRWLRSQEAPSQKFVTALTHGAQK